MSRDESPLNMMYTTLGSLKLACSPLPRTIAEAARLIDHPKLLEMGPVTEMVQGDPVVVTKLLHIANTTYYGGRGAVDSVERAVTLLGPVTVTGIVKGMNACAVIPILDDPAAHCFGRLIRHSIATAFLTSYLWKGILGESKACLRKLPLHLDVSFTAGLLHDLGKVFLVYNFPEEAVGFYEKNVVGKLIREPDARSLEQLVFGYDHIEIGEYVARRLGLPESLVDVIRCHHEPERTSGTEKADRLVRATAGANLAAKAMGYAFGEPTDWERATSGQVWTLLVQRDLPQYGNTASLLDEIQALQEPLDHFVDAMTTSIAPVALNGVQ